jgi:hypothetical protein
MKINNVVTMRVWRMTISNGNPLNRGKIGLQNEAAGPVDFRNWQVMDLSNPNPIVPMRKEARVRAATLLLGPAAYGMPALIHSNQLGTRVFDLSGRTLGAFPLEVTKPQ